MVMVVEGRRARSSWVERGGGLEEELGDGMGWGVGGLYTYYIHTDLYHIGSIESRRSRKRLYHDESSHWSIDAPAPKLLPQQL